MRPHILLLWLALLAAGCAGGDALRFRANSPPIDDAFRRLSVALALDGYTLERTDAAARTVETGWRTFPDSMRASAPEAARPIAAARIKGVLVPRGRMYDVVLTITIREATSSGIVERPVEIHEALALRWRGVMKGLFEEEVAEED